MAYISGERHPRAADNNHVVAAVLGLKAQGRGYKSITRETGVPISTVRDWCKGNTRASATHKPHPPINDVSAQCVDSIHLATSAQQLHQTRGSSLAFPNAGTQQRGISLGCEC